MGGRRVFKAAAVLITLGYCSLLVYQGGVTFNFQENRAGSVQVSDLSIEPVTKTSILDSGQNKNISLDDIFISVKTTKHYQYTRLPIILKTWYQLAKQQTWFFTDTENRQHQNQTSGHMVNTNCSASHQRKHLCCKMSVEYDHFLESGKKDMIGVSSKSVANPFPFATLNLLGDRSLAAAFQEVFVRDFLGPVNTDNLAKTAVKENLELKPWPGKDFAWFCHFDDDNYVNVPRLVSVLQKYNHQEDWYLGRTSVYEPVKIYKKPTNQLMFSFWFATGGAGFCISRSLALKMLPVASGGRFISICEGIRLPDDVSMGFIIEHMMKKNLTLVPEFHSHLEQMKLLPSETFRDQISFSYVKAKDEWNVVNVPGFDTRYDPTRFLSLHCFLFPHFKFCPR